MALLCEADISFRPTRVSFRDVPSPAPGKLFIRQLQTAKPYQRLLFVTTEDILFHRFFFRDVGNIYLRYFQKYKITRRLNGWNSISQPFSHLKICPWVPQIAGCSLCRWRWSSVADNCLTCGELRWKALVFHLRTSRNYITVNLKPQARVPSASGSGSRRSPPHIEHRGCLRVPYVLGSMYRRSKMKWSGAVYEASWHGQINLI